MTQIDSNTCVHYWVIESANGPVSLGVCQKCQERRHFHNYSPDISGENRWGQRKQQITLKK